MTPEQEIRLCMDVQLSNNQWRKLKIGLRKHGLNVFSPIKSFNHERQKATNIADYRVMQVETTLVLWMTNICAVIGHRCATLSSRGQLPLDKFNKKLIIGLVGDKGADHVKIGVSLGNAPHPNNPYNMTLIGLYKGKTYIFFTFTFEN